MHPHAPRPIALLLAGLLAAPALLHAQQDAPAVDIGQLLQSLRAIRQQQATAIKSQKTTAYQQIASAAGSTERAVALWEDAVRATQMEGAAKETAAFKAWREGEGKAFEDREVQNAVRLHLQWLALTLKHSAGVLTKDMLQDVVSYTRDLAADEAAIESLQDAIKHEKELGAKDPKRAQRSRDDTATKRAHDTVIKMKVGDSPVAQWMKLGDLVKADKWEQSPGNYDGIFKNIVLPELRTMRDARALEYWDLKLKKEADAASKSRLAFEIEKFNTQRRPSLLWSRADEYLNIGQKNRAVTEMFALIKAYPTHPDADDWIGKLEEVIMPPTPPAAPEGAAPAPAGAPPAAPIPAPAPLPPPVPNVPGL
jgi:Tfp pilus assembly protein PilV